MFDVGFFELALIGSIALIVLGPERLPAAARTAGLWIGKFRRMLREASAEIDSELRQYDVRELDELKQEMESGLSPKSRVAKTAPAQPKPAPKSKPKSKQMRRKKAAPRGS